jgi:hypothetical protein
MVSNTELQGQLNAANVQIQRLLEQVTALGGGSLSAKVVSVKRYDTVVDAPTLATLAELRCGASNPVQRSNGSAATCAKMDLALERGWISVRQASPSVQIEYKNWAPSVSYLYDLVELLKVQCNAIDVPEERRGSLAIPLTGLEELLGYMISQLDLLKLKGERPRDPEVVEAVAQAIHGQADLPLASPTVWAAYSQVSHLALMAAFKTAAKAQAKPGARKDAAQVDH